jgi:uncharacterized membrane-anchored protein YjiN (DUF445 family)
MTTKTKNELMEEIEQKNEEIRVLDEEVKRLEKYKTYDQSAEEIKGVMDSYIRAGFSEEQAFTLIQLLLTANLRGANTSNFYLGRK